MKGSGDVEANADVSSRETDPMIVRDGVSEPTPWYSKDQCLSMGKEVAYLPFPFNQNLWLNNLAKHFGYKLLVMLFASQHLMKGFVMAFTAPATQFLFASYHVEGPQMQIFAGITSLPWAMKPIIGLISDCLPIRGYNKGSYILIASIFGVFAMAAIGHLPQERLSIEGLVMCLFLCQLQMSTCDLLTEAKYAEKMQARPEQGPLLMAYVWFGLQVGGLVATVMIGPLMSYFSPKAPFMLAMLPAVFICLPVARNYLEETPQTRTELAAARSFFAKQKEACLLCVLMFVGTVILTVLGIHYKSIYVNAIAALSVAFVMLVAFSLVLRPIIAKTNAFFLIQTSLGFSISGASFYFYTDKPEQYPDGPHFSMEFYTSVLGVVGSIFSLLGIYSYQKYMKDWKYRHLLLFTNCTFAVLNLLDAVMFSRLNKRIGIPDHVFVLGASVIQTVIGQWMWMPGIVILSQLCPKGMEATMYALLAGCHNLGNTIGQNCGALMLKWFACSPAGKPHEGHQFDNLWKASLVSTALPTLMVIVIPLLIPDARQTDKLLVDEDRDATAGSLWKRLTAK